jgi:hypothetical protein
MLGDVVVSVVLVLVQWVEVRCGLGIGIPRTMSVATR